MCSILMLGRYICDPACPVLYRWKLVSVKTAVDLQLLQTRCVVIRDVEAAVSSTASTPIASASNSTWILSEPGL